MKEEPNQPETGDKDDSVEEPHPLVRKDGLLISNWGRLGLQRSLLYFLHKHRMPLPHSGFKPPLKGKAVS